MTNIDLKGPLEDFYERTRQIRAIVSAIEAAGKQKSTLTTNRRDVDLSIIGLSTGNTVNAMSIVFLASSFEEFIREEIGQCADYLSHRYSTLSQQMRYTIRASYWSGCLERLQQNKSIMTKGKAKVPDATVMSKVRSIVESARGFVVDDDASHIDRTIFCQQSHNFRPHIVDQIGSRIGINNLVDSAADSTKLRSYFGVTKKSEVSTNLRSKLDEFYERRNDIVHSLTGTTGYAVDVVIDYIELFELTAESIQFTLAKATAAW